MCASVPAADMRLHTENTVVRGTAQEGGKICEISIHLWIIVWISVIIGLWRWRQPEVQPFIWKWEKEREQHGQLAHVSFVHLRSLCSFTLSTRFSPSAVQNYSPYKVILSCYLEFKLPLGLWVHLFHISFQLSACERCYFLIDRLLSGLNSWKQAVYC